MKRAALPVLAVLLATAPVAAPSVVETAERAIRDGLPQAAIAPLQNALRKAPAADKNRLGLLLTRAQLAAGRPADALRTLDSTADRSADDATVLRAAALAAQGALEPAAELLGPLAEGDTEAALLLARIRFEQGNHKAASAILAGTDAATPRADPNILRLLLDAQLAAGNQEAAAQTIERARENSILPSAELEVALGRLRLAADRASEASEIFRRVLESSELPAPVRDNAQLGLARSLVALGLEARARDVLREAMADAPEAPTVKESLRQWIDLEKKLGGDPATTLRTWAAEDGNRRAVESGLRLARLDLDGKNVEAAVAALEKVLADPDITPSDAARARLLLAEARISSGQARAALEILETLAAQNADATTGYRLDSLRGRALAAGGNQRQALEAFAAALARATTPDETAAAAANSLLCALALGDLTVARQSLEKIRQATPESPDLVRWAFLLAAAEARAGEIDALTALARRSPANEYSFQAKLALAEWRLARGEATAAQRTLLTAREEAATPARATALAAAEIFAADNAASQTREELVAASRDFLAAHPGTPEAADVSFKLGELHARSGDHAAAEAVFAQLARDLADPETAQLAKFLAAQSAGRSMSADGAGRALQWFDEIAQSNSPLRHRARFEQATLLLRERRFDDALKLYDVILSGDPPPEVRLAALMEKGDTLVALGADQSEKLADAAALFAGLAGDTSAPADWRDQAACKRAGALARAGQTEAALAAYREVLARPPGTATDFFWFYKAGLEAGRLLEQQEDWPAAIAVYDLLASAAGPQSEEIKLRSRRLRLEHFIWEN